MAVGIGCVDSTVSSLVTALTTSLLAHYFTSVPFTAHHQQLQQQRNPCQRSSCSIPRGLPFHHHPRIRTFCRVCASRCHCSVPCSHLPHGCCVCCCMHIASCIAKSARPAPWFLDIVVSVGSRGIGVGSPASPHPLRDGSVGGIGLCALVSANPGACVRACVRARACACVRARARVCVCVCV
jgi:hypothetical protein